MVASLAQARMAASEVFPGEIRATGDTTQTDKQRRDG